MPPRNGAVRAFVGLCIATAVAFGGYLAWPRSAAAPPAAPATSDALATIRRGPYAMFRSTAIESYGRLELATSDARGPGRYATPLTCERVHFAGGRGVCLTADRGLLTTYRAYVFDEGFVSRHEIELPGAPSRVRVSPDGRRAGITVFVSGDSYANPGGFSTRALIVDLVDGRVMGNLEEFAVTRDGKPFARRDFNFWGITFANGRRFYATLATGRRTYLVEGDIETKRARTLHEGVECPSLSPDHTRIVFKKRYMTGIRRRWGLAVLDLATMRETPLAETRNVDDQAEWLDDGHVAYGLASETRAGSTDVWSLPADGSGAPHLLFENAWSPAFAAPPVSNAEVADVNVHPEHSQEEF